MAGIPAIFALVPEGVEEEFVAESAQDELVELFLNELVSVHLVDLFLALSHGTLAAETPDSFCRSFPKVFLGWIPSIKRTFKLQGNTH